MAEGKHAWQSLSILVRKPLFVKLTVVLMTLAFTSGGFSTLYSQFFQANLGFRAADQVGPACAWVQCAPPGDPHLCWSLSAASILNICWCCLQSQVIITAGLASLVGQTVVLRGLMRLVGETRLLAIGDIPVLIGLRQHACDKQASTGALP